MINDIQLQGEIRPYLHPNEEILWVGRPTSTRMLKRSIFPAFFSIFFIGFAIFWMASAAMVGGMFFLFGIPFLLVGGGMLYSATIGQKNTLQKSVYAVTETRAILLVTLPRTGTNCKEYIFSNLSSVTLENVQDDVGTIRFEDIDLYHYGYGRYNRHRGAGYSIEHEFTTAFVMIDDVHKVYHLISERLGK